MSGSTTAEQLLISALINTHDVKAASSFGLTPEYIQGYPAEYKWLINYVEVYGEQPSREAFLAAFPTFRLVDHENVRFAVDMVFKAYGRRALTAAMTEAYDALEYGDPHLAFSVIMEKGEPRRTRSEPRRLLTDMSFMDNWDEPQRGVEVPYPTLQHHTKGILPGNLWYLAARPGQGKMLADDEPILTPKGWVRNGDLVVGDLVIGSNGKPTRIIGVYPQGLKQVYEVTFSDKTVIQAGDEHLWTVRRGNKPWKVQTTAQIAKRMENGGERYCVPTLSGPVRFSDHEAPPYPAYQLGLLLGDGGLSGNTVRLSTADPELVECFGRNAVRQQGNHGYDYSILRLTPLMKRLGLHGKRSEAKFVPPVYLTASPATRHAMLQGLLDSDGGPTGTGGVEFSSTSLQLARDVQFLAESLGGYAHWHQRQTRCNGKPGLVSYRLIVVLPEQFPPFRLERKAERYQPRMKYLPARSIVSAVATSQYVPMTCIAVEAPDSLYATRGCILTHNTAHLVNMVKHAVFTANRVRFFSLEMSEAEVRARFHAALAQQYGYPGITLNTLRDRSVDKHSYKTFLGELSDKLAGAGGDLHIHTPTNGPVSPGVVAAGADEYDLTVIDYVGLMKADGGSAAVDDWRLAAKISNTLKEIGLSASTGILAASQINRDGEHGNLPPKVKNLAQSDALGQDGDVVATMRSAPHNVGTMFSLEKNRHGPSGISFQTLFDPNRGIFTEVSAERLESMVLDAEADR